MNALEKLAILVIQGYSNDGILGHLGQFGTSRSQALQDIVNDAMRQLQAGTAHEQESAARLIKRSIAVIKESLKEETSTQVTQVHSAYFGTIQVESEANNDVEEMIKIIDQVQLPPSGNLSASDDEIPKSHLEALCFFMSEFPIRFGVDPESMKGAEIDDVICVAERIWESANVQTLSPDKRYDAFAELMTEDVIGSHMVYEEDETVRKTLFKTIQDRIGSALKERYSSHYVSSGRREEKHRGISGNLFPATLMYHGYVGEKDGKIVTGKGAAYWDKLKTEQRNGAKKMFVTWRQREARGTETYTSMFLHCVVDFPSYWIRKKFLSPHRPQIAKHHKVEPNQKVRGKPDTDPVIIRLQRVSTK